MEVVAPPGLKLNLGSGEIPLDGWTNVDAIESKAIKADIYGDIRELEFEGVIEVNMSHLLEHISWQQTDFVLKRIRSWMVRGAPITVEVPDMEVIAPDITNPWWVIYTYGVQTHPGEVHLNGFTATTLSQALYRARFREVEVRAFLSSVPYRAKMPCIEAKAIA